MCSYVGGALFGTIRNDSPHMYCWSRVKVIVSYGNSYHMGLMIGTPVIVEFLKVV